MKYDGMDVDIRDVQRVQLEILLEFDRICKKKGITYQLFAGTLLGAIRHNGFIPWDDDIDVCLLREDYERFLDVCGAELDEKYVLQNFEMEYHSSRQFTKIRKKNTLFREKAYRDTKMHEGIFIDVFPLDNVKPNTPMGRIHRIMVNALYVMTSSRERTRCLGSKTVARKYTRLACYYLQRILPPKTLDAIAKRIICMFNKEKTRYVTHLTNGASRSTYDRYMMEREHFYDVILGKFEGHYFPIPKNFDSVLARLFGDYMNPPPVSERKPHHGIIEVSFNVEAERL